MEIVSYKRNCLGTMSFSLKFKGMRKVEEFIVYPIREKGSCIYFQSNHRWAELNLSTMTFEVSASKPNYADSVWFQFCKVTKRNKLDRCTVEQFNAIVEQISYTSGKNVGSNILNITSDNSEASKLLEYIEK